MGNEGISPESQISRDDPWAITNKIKREVEEARIAIERSRQEFESQILQCPFDESDSTFVRYQGAYTRGWSIFRCEKEAHEFQVG